MAQVLTLQRLHSNRRGQGRDHHHPRSCADREARPAQPSGSRFLMPAGLLLLAFCILPGGLAGQGRARLTATARVLHAEPSQEALTRLPKPGLETPALSQTSLAMVRVEVAPADSVAQARRRVTIAFVRN